MFLLDSTPAILRVFCVFVLLLLAIKRKIPLGATFFGGSLVLGLLFGMTPRAMGSSLLQSLTASKTLSLACVVCLILVLSHSMELAGQMERLLDRFQGLISRPKVNLIIFPAMIGLLPMPGGAIFSAPMVKSLGGCTQLSSSQLSYINYWFRHIWEYWWPLYPGVLLATALAQLDIWIFVLFLSPLTILAVLVGFLSLGWLNRRKASSPDDCIEPAPLSSRPSFGPFLHEVIPIVLVIGLGLGLGSLLTPLLKPQGIAVSKELGLVAALILAIGWVWHSNGLSAAQRRRILTQKPLLHMFTMVAGILVFQGMLEDSRAVSAISRELMDWHIPLVPITIILPFLVGGIVGITIAFVGTTFPILISLIQAAGEENLMLPYIMLALTSGIMGVLLSPLHVCLLLSNEYFCTPMAPVYRHLWLPSLLLMTAVTFYFWFLRNLFS